MKVPLARYYLTICSAAVSRGLLTNQGHTRTRFSEKIYHLSWSDVLRVFFTLLIAYHKTKTPPCAVNNTSFRKPDPSLINARRFLT